MSYIYTLNYENIYVMKLIIFKQKMFADLDEEFY